MSTTQSVPTEERQQAKAATTSIGRRILIRSLAVGLTPLILLGFVVILGLSSLNNTAATRADESREVLAEESVEVASEEQAASVAREINLLLNERIRNVQAWARSSEVVIAATDGAAQAVDESLVARSIDDLEAEFAETKRIDLDLESRNFLRSELEANTDFAEIVFTEANGLNVAFTAETDDFVQRDEEWWTGAMENGVHVSDVDYDQSAELFSVEIAVRIEDPATGEALGVLRSVLGIGFVQEFADGRSTDSVEYVVALADGRLIADTVSDHNSFRMMSLNFAGAAASPGLGRAMDADLQPGTSDVEITEDFVYGYTTTLDPTAFSTVEAEGFAGFDWIVVSTQTSEAAFAPLRGVEALKTDIADAGGNLRTIIILVLLAGVVAAYFMARQTAQGIVKPIQKLTDAATEAADVGLPWAVEEISAEGADFNSIKAPEVEISTGDELQVLAGAFNSVQASALRLAAVQAQSRRNTTEMFVNLGRRNQSLLKRQLRFIDTLEANEQDPDTLESLFKLDHLATRMRRNAESLLVLAGDRSPRRWAKPIEVQSAVEAALAEVENYERVDFGALDDGKIQGNIVADVAHILAEVIENGLNFSPPTAGVAVVGRNAGERYIVTVTDEGFGMKQEEIERINEQLATVIEITEVPSQQLGLFVVARLANRHGIDVRLTNGSTGGLSVRIEVPLAEDRAKSTDSTPASSKTKGVEVVSDELDEAAEADAEVQELLAKAEAAVAKAAAIRADRDEREILEEAERAEARRDADADAEADSADDTDSAEDVNDGEETSVAVGEFSFPRRGAKAKAETPAKVEAKPAPKPKPEPKPKQRRKSDAAEGEKAPAEVDEYGFKRRESKRAPKDTTVSGRRKSDSKTGPSKTASSKDGKDDVQEVAEKSRSQWGSFQRGKAEAENAADGSAVTTAEQANAETAGNSAGKKEK